MPCQNFIRRSTAFGAFALIVLFSLCLPGTAYPNKFTFGNWRGSSVYSDSGTFRRCIVAQRYGDGTTLTFSITDRGRFEVWLLNESWTLENNKEYKIEYRIDNLDKYSGNARVLDKYVVSIVISNPNTLFEQFRKGHIFHLYAKGQEFHFGLRGSYRALDKLYDCYESAPETDSIAQNPFAPEAAPISRPDSGSAEKSVGKKADGIAAQFAKLAIRIMNGEDIEIVDKPPAEIKRVRPELVWTTKHGFGVAKEAKLTARTAVLEKLLTYVDRAACAGKFTSRATTRSLSSRPGVEVSVIKTACLKDNEIGAPFYVVYTFYPLSNGRTIGITHLALDPDDANAADTRFFEAAERIFAPLDRRPN